MKIEVTAPVKASDLITVLNAAIGRDAGTVVTTTYNTIKIGPAEPEDEE